MKQLPVMQGSVEVYEEFQVLIYIILEPAFCTLKLEQTYYFFILLLLLLLLSLYFFITLH